ncbi:uncharacterized protein L201_005791 [Kwoniella dendrophila CBS 6074]|uniref:Transmembrane protein n=1 Tax=Kwoniella dendrophila CBS 6074 TaxID=1295534 RepID=A0AAX4K0B0_9TREE
MGHYQKEKRQLIHHEQPQGEKMDPTLINEDQPKVAPATTVLDKDEDHSRSSYKPRTTIFLNTFPPDFPIQTLDPPTLHSDHRGYLFLKDNQLLDSILIFLMIFGTFLFLTITCIKCNSFFTKLSNSNKTDQVIMDDMKWAEGREVIERRIIYEEINPNPNTAKRNGRKSFLGIGKKVS